MTATRFWTVLKNGQSKQFTSRKDAVAWERNQPDYPRGRYHIYNNDPDAFMSVRNKGKSYRR